jgi:hypothetical protein
MASTGKKLKSSVPDVAAITKAYPYIQRLIEDATLRENVQQAIDSTKKAYGRLSNGKAPHRALMEDKKLQADIRQVYDSVRYAQTALTEPPKRKKRKFGRRLLVLAIGGGLALAGSEKLRSKVLDTLFGAEEEFEYTPPASATPTPPATPVSPS